MLCPPQALPAGPFPGRRGAAGAGLSRARLCPQMTSTHQGVEVETWEQNKSNVHKALVSASTSWQPLPARSCI